MQLRSTYGVSGCRGLCERIGVKFGQSGNISIYSLGYKHCPKCARSLKVEGKYCPCCGRAMRTKSHSSYAVRKRRDEVFRY